MLVHGPQPAPPHWDTAWRSTLVRNLALLVPQLWSEGVTEIFVDGSFVEDKLRPGDIDGYYVCTRQQIVGGLLQRLNAKNPAPIWSMNTVLPDPVTRKSKPLMWHRHKVELYADTGQMSNIQDEFGHNQTFPAAFRKARRQRGWKPKGIIQIVQ